MAHSANARIGIGGDLIDSVFPFHIAFDAGMQVLQVGPSLRTLAPELVVGDDLGSHLRLRRPSGELSEDVLRSGINSPFVLELVSTGTRLRGQFVEARQDRWLFLGSPWFESADDIEAAGLSLADFPPHDPMIDLLMIGQSQQMAMRDLRNLTEKLDQQRRAVRRTELIYRQAIAAADSVAYKADFLSDVFEFIDADIEHLTGYKAEDLSPSFFHGLVRERRELPGPLPGSSLSGAPVRRMEYRIRAKDGTERWLAEASIEVEGTSDSRMRVIGILEDVTERRHHDRERERLQADLDAILRLSPDGFAAFDTETGLSYCNPAFESFVGRSRESLTGMSLGGADDLFRALAGKNDCGSLLALGEEENDEVDVTRPKLRTLTRTLLRMRREGSLRGFVLFVRDVTREREVDRLKSEFLSTAAHELRTPMTSVRGFAELLLSDTFDQDTTREIAETIHRQSSLLVEIVNELLDIARIEAERAKVFSIEDHDVHDLVGLTVSALRFPNDDREVEVTLLPGAAPVISIDPGKTVQALTNVLSNAFKYSPGGGRISLTVSRRQTESGSKIAIDVADQGIGMHQGELDRLFERFYRADPSGTIPGTGLGMSLVKEIMELQGGSIEVVSTKGVGTNVSLMFPESKAAGVRSGGDKVGGHG